MGAQARHRWAGDDRHPQQPPGPGSRGARPDHARRADRAFALVLVAAALLAGLFISLRVQRRGQAIDDLATRSGPLTVAAQEIYRSLSDADATATGAFLAGGLESAATRQRYEADIAQAANALAIAVAAREPADVTVADSPLATLAGQLPVYTGLVETARADNRQGLPLGAAYQREASNLMRTRLPPAAQALYGGEADQLAGDQDSASNVPWAEILLALVVIGLLVAAQAFVRRRTNRVLNAGLLVATAAVVVSLLWVLVATTSAMKESATVAATAPRRWICSPRPGSPRSTRAPTRRWPSSPVGPAALTRTTT